MGLTPTAKDTTNAALRRIPFVRALGGPGDVREAAGVLERERRQSGTTQLLGQAARAIPWVIVLLGRLALDRRVALRHRAGIVGAAAYLAIPIDPILDFLPIIGALDDALVALMVVRWVIRSVDPKIVAEHWSGSPAMLDTVRALAGDRRG